MSSSTRHILQHVQLRAVEGSWLPLDLFKQLAHLPGAVWLDSSGNHQESAAPISVIGAQPEEVLHGHLSDLEALREVLTRYSPQGAGESPLPAGGLIGWVDYEGYYCFGVYPQILVFEHQSSQWWEAGDLLSERALKRTSSIPKIGEFQPTMSRRQYENKVRQVKEYIRAGDLYQVNLCQQFKAKVSGEGELLALYEHLRAASPAPMAAYLKLDGREILSSSPESFLRIDGGDIRTRPIKGTRPRFRDPVEDRRSAFELQTSEKEIAELVMITDLLRNDLGQVSEFGSVEVLEMLKLESFEQVHHLVSTVKGRLRAEIDALEALNACFPGGSITGAPKKRSMEVIQELEGGKRGLYTGSIGYLGFNGVAHFNIAIRTLIREAGSLHYHVGAGIVADSDPAAEYLETLNKAEGLRLAVRSFLQQ